MFATPILVAGGLLGLAGVSNAETTRQQEIENVLQAHAEQGASGILRIAVDGEVIFESGYGSASCEADEPVTPEHIFMIGSITKEFTQILAYILEERGVLSFDDRVDDHLVEFDGPIGAVTLRQLVDHTGRVPDLIDRDGNVVPYSVEYDYEPVTREDLIARAELAQLIDAGDDEEVYSNLGYQMLAAIYETATATAYAALLDHYVFEPAGMTDTAFWYEDHPKRDFAEGCLPGGARWGNPVEDAMWSEAGPSWNLVGAGGLLSTAASLARFFDGIAAGVFFESPEQMQRYKEDRMVYSERRRQHLMGPAGSNGILNAVAFWTDRDRLSVVLMTNRADHTAEGGLVQEIIGLFPPESFDTAGEVIHGR